MSKTLLECFEQGIVKIGDYVEYKPIKSFGILKTSETGSWGRRFEEQILYTEELKYQFAGFYSGKPFLLSDSVTKQIIWLEGEIGYQNGGNALQKLHQQCWSNEQIGAIGTCLTYFMYCNLPAKVKKTKTGKACYWLNSVGSFCKNTSNYSGLDYVCENNEFKTVEICNMIGKTENRIGLQNNGMELAIRPAIILLENFKC